MKKVLICNDGIGSPNKGDQAILTAMLDDFRRINPRLQLELFPFSGLRNLKKFFNFLVQIRKSDLFVLGGGHPFQDQTSQAFLLFGLFLILIARFFNKGVLCYAVGAGPITGRLGKKITGSILNRVNVITARDPVSKQILVDRGIREDKIVVTADAAFTLKTVSNKRIKRILQEEGIEKDKRPLIAFCLRRWFCFQSGFWPLQFRTGKAKRALGYNCDVKAAVMVLQNFCRYLIEKYHARIVFIPMRKSQHEMDFGQDDDRFSLEIMHLLDENQNAVLLKGEYSPAELKGIFSTMDLVVSSRLHPLIMSVCEAVPVLGIPFTRSKGEGFFSQIGRPADYVYIDKLDLKILISIFERIWHDTKHVRLLLKNRSEILRTEAGENIKILKMLLGR
jgi:polysaccharide pyruvyl transferase WcaK-like protein